MPYVKPAIIPLVSQGAHPSDLIKVSEIVSAAVGGKWVKRN
jgi:hypothetical protein